MTSNSILMSWTGWIGGLVPRDFWRNCNRSFDFSNAVIRWYGRVFVLCANKTGKFGCRAAFSSRRFSASRFRLSLAGVLGFSSTRCCFFTKRTLTATFFLWNMPWFTKQVELLLMVVSLISSVWVLCIQERCLMCCIVSSSTCRFVFLFKKWVRNVLVTTSGQNRAFSDWLWTMALHSGVFCTFGSLRRYTKLLPASVLISVIENNTWMSRFWTKTGSGWSPNGLFCNYCHYSHSAIALFVSLVKWCNSPLTNFNVIHTFRYW